ncbi:MAG TPA: hypothetical protein VE981_11040 [Planctomycetota bacterium]|nr:hypothetical protein [Planctomycetota bacterium]
MTDDRPVVLVVEQEFRDLAILSISLSTGPVRLATCPVEGVALEFVAESRPAAVLLDARTLYLEGPPCLERWRSASPDTRVLFVDVDGPWCLLMELASADSGQVDINPCGVEEFARAVEELLMRKPVARSVETEDSKDDHLAVAAV